jgi:hypothetical protein
VVTSADRGQFLLDYIDLLLKERVDEAAGFRHSAPMTSEEAERARREPAQGRERWVINKLRALNSWYTKGLDGGSHLRIAINSAVSIAHLRDIIHDFFFVAPSHDLRHAADAPTGRGTRADNDVQARVHVHVHADAGTPVKGHIAYAEAPGEGATAAHDRAATADCVVTRVSIADEHSGIDGLNAADALPAGVA